MPTKCTPKSCSCSACRRGKHAGGKSIMKGDERAFRHDAKAKLSSKVERTNSFDELDDVDITSAPIGNYYD